MLADKNGGYNSRRDGALIRKKRLGIEIYTLNPSFFMYTLTKNVIDIQGERSRFWVETLALLIKTLACHWSLTDIIPVPKMSYNFVATARCDGQAVVLKIGFNKTAIAEEYQALTYFNGQAVIRLLDYHEPYHALLLEQAVPGITLQSLYSTQEETVIADYVDTVKRLLDKRRNAMGQFRHLKEWLKALDEGQSDRIPVDLLTTAIDLKNGLLSTSSKESVLHGDLHLDNIVKHQANWVVIDPKGVIGEREFEVVAFDFIRADEMKRGTDFSKLLDKRLDLLAKKSHLDADRLKSWLFVKSVLSAVWHIEDHGDPRSALRLAQTIKKQLPYSA